MGFHPRTKEVVVVASHIFSVDHWLPSDHRRKQCAGAVHLYPVLMKNAREKETIIGIMVGLIAFYAIFSLPWLWIAALIVGVMGTISDRMTHYIHVVWFWIGGRLGYVMSKIVLGLIFFLILLPLALLARLFRKDFMLLKSNYPSYFIDRPVIYQRKDLENPW